MILKITIRTYFSRLFYTYKSLFGFSLAFCLVPYCKSKNLDEKSSNNFYDRHSTFFNTNDFLIGYAIGIILNLEESGKIEDIEKVKTVLSSTLGAIGDKLIYKTILPIFVLLIINIITLAKFQITLYSAVPILLIILSFTIFNFSIKYFGIKHGYNMGIKSLNIFKSSKYKDFNSLFSITKYILLAILIVNLLVVFFM